MTRLTKLTAVEMDVRVALGFHVDLPDLDVWQADGLIMRLATGTFLLGVGLGAGIWG